MLYITIWSSIIKIKGDTFSDVISKTFQGVIYCFYCYSVKAHENPLAPILLHQYRHWSTAQSCHWSSIFNIQIEFQIKEKVYQSIPCDLLLFVICRYACSSSSAGGLIERAGTMRYTRDKKKNSTMRDTRFQPRMKPQPTTLEARVMTCPTASGARMLVTWSIRLMVAFIPFVRIKDTEVNVLPVEDFQQEQKWTSAWYSLSLSCTNSDASLWQTHNASQYAQ